MKILIVPMVVGAVAGLIAILTYDSRSVSPGDLFRAIVYVRMRREGRLERSRYVTIIQSEMPELR